jgi:N-acetylated-alpha-linked acidic dipeptidase
MQITCTTDKEESRCAPRPNHKSPAPLCREPPSKSYHRTPGSLQPKGSLLNRLRHLVLLLAAPLLAGIASAQTTPAYVFGYRDFTQQARWDKLFLDIPDARLAGEHLHTLTIAPHWASSPQDLTTALYVEQKFKDAGLSTHIIPYRVYLNRPTRILIEAFTANGRQILSGPSPEHIDEFQGEGGPSSNAGIAQEDTRILPPFSGGSPSGDVTGEAVYANYGTLADFRKLEDLGISVKDKIVLVRYGANFRGVKVYLAQQRGARGVLIYSDPADDGYFLGDPYPFGPYRPDSSVQLGSTEFLPIYPGDPQTPGFASTTDLPDSKRIPINKLQGILPSIPVNPLSYKDAAPILRALSGANVPHDWQGALPFPYHLGAAGKSNRKADPVRIHMHLEQDYALRTIWDVIGSIPGSDPTQKDDLVIAGNHRDAWVYGAADPSSGTAAMLETVHGLGALLHAGWHPHRTIVIASWDAEEQGLIGSTEWVEDHPEQLRRAVAYFNTDVAVSGPYFNASAVPSLQQFLREIAHEVPSPRGGSVYDQWKKDQIAEISTGDDVSSPQTGTDLDDVMNYGQRLLRARTDVRIGALGSGSDYTPFLQHAGVPATDIGSDGPYGVYHSAFDNYAWFLRNADPTFVYLQQQARVFGLEILHMADADVLPYDYTRYGTEISGYLADARRHASANNLHLSFAPAQAAAQRFTAAGLAIRPRQIAPPTDPTHLNHTLRAVESALLDPAGLPGRPWYRHTIYAPGVFTGYAAVVIPGVNEAIELPDAPLAQTQLAALTAALNRAAALLENAAHQPASSDRPDP